MLRRPPRCFRISIALLGLALDLGVAGGADKVGVGRQSHLGFGRVVLRPDRHQLLPSRRRVDGASRFPGSHAPESAGSRTRSTPRSLESRPELTSRVGLQPGWARLHGCRAIGDHSRARGQGGAGNQKSSRDDSECSLPHDLGVSLNRSRAFWKSSAVISPLAKRRARMSSGDSEVATAGVEYRGRHELEPAIARMNHTTRSTTPARNSNPPSPLRSPNGKKPKGAKWPCITG